MTRKAILVYDLNDPGVERVCVATKSAVTTAPCAHGYTWQCPHVTERYVFDTTSPAAAEAMGQAVPDR